MKKPTKVLAFDLGVSTSPVGWAFAHFLFENTTATDVEAGDFWAKRDGKKSTPKSWKYFYRKTKELFDIYKPDTVMICRPMGRFAGTVYQQAKQAGIIEMICEYRGVQFLDKPDTVYRTCYWGTKTTKKQNAQRLDIKNEDRADAVVAAICARKLWKNPPKKKVRKKKVSEKS